MMSLFESFEVERVFVKSFVTNVTMKVNLEKN